MKIRLSTNKRAWKNQSLEHIAKLHESIKNEAKKVADIGGHLEEESLVELSRDSVFSGAKVKFHGQDREFANIVWNMKSSETETSDQGIDLQTVDSRWLEMNEEEGILKVKDSHFHEVFEHFSGGGHYRRVILSDESESRTAVLNSSSGEGIIVGEGWRDKS